MSQGLATQAVLGAASPRTTSSKSWASAALALILSAVVGAALVWQSEAQRLSVLRTEVLRLAQAHADALERNLAADMGAAYAVAALVRGSGGAPADFSRYASELRRFFPDLVAINLAPGGIVREISPRQGNESALGLDLFADPVRAAEAVTARDTGLLTLSGPFDLMLGGRGVVGRLPVFLDASDGSSRFWGFVNVVVRFPQTLDRAGLDQLREHGLDYVLWRTSPGSAERQVIAASTPSVLPSPVEHRLNVLSAAEWRLSVMPVAGWADPWGLSFKSAIALAFCLLLAALAKLLVDTISRGVRLEAQVAERTQEIRSRESDLRRAEAIAGFGSWVYDFSRRGLWASPQGRRLIGLAGAAPPTLADFLEPVHAEDRPAVEAAWLGALDGRGYELEHRLLVGGRVRWVRQLAELELDGQGAPVRAIITLQDISERRASRERMELVLTKYRTLFDAFPLGIVVSDARGRILEQNEIARRLLGIDEGTLEQRDIDGHEWRILRPDSSLMAAEDYPSVVALREQRLVHDVDMGVVRPDGEIAWITVTAAPLPVAEGGVVIAFADARESIRADRELRIAATVFEAQEGMLVTDADCVILRVNRAFCETTGYSIEEVVGKTPRLLQSGHHDDAFYHGMWEAIHQAGVWQGEIWNRRKNGEIYPEWLTITAVKDRDGLVTNYVGTHTDITQRKAAENEIRHLAYYDPLTQLPNRRLLMDRLHQSLANAARYSQRGALLFIDLDNFKTLNDTLGHEVGDLLLQQVAARLVESVREGDTVARFGGDEFVVMLQYLGASPEGAGNLARIVGEKIRARLDQPYQLGVHAYSTTPSIGVVLFGDGEEALDELLRLADLAMYQAKAAGRNRLHFFDPAMQSALLARTTLEENLRSGLSCGHLLLHYQPQVDDRDRLLGAEGLVRWLHPQHGWVAPSEIIQLAESTGQVLLLAQRVLEIACDQLMRWGAQGREQLTLSVNISPREFRHPGFVAMAETVLERSGARADRLILELPESLILSDLTETLERMKALERLGLRFALDNFGNGIGSLTSLRRLPLEQVKIGPSFVKTLFSHPNEDAIARAFIDLIHGLGLQILAEGVETQEQREYLTRHGCRAFQGYLIGRPGPAVVLTG